MNAHLYTMALDAVATTIPEIAQRKNLSVSAEEGHLLARIILEGLHAREIRDLAALRPNAVALAVHSISRALDVLALCRELECRAERNGGPPLDWGRAWPAVQQVVDAFVANDAEPAMFGWPSVDEVDAYQAGIRLPVVVKLNSGTGVTFGHHRAAAPSSAGDTR